MAQIERMVPAEPAEGFDALAYNRAGIERLDRIVAAVTELSIANYHLTSDISAEARQLFHSTGNLRAEQTIRQNQLERLRLAQLRYDTLVYPAGMNSQIAAETAEKFRLSVGDSGELIAEAYTE